MLEIINAFGPEAFAGYTALGSLLVIPTVELLRAHVLTSLDGVLVIVLAVAVGAIYGALGFVAGFFPDTTTVIGAFGFGAWAGVLASGANKYLDAKLGKSSAGA
jgi:hypothetical protein